MRKTKRQSPGIFQELAQRVRMMVTRTPLITETREPRRRGRMPPRPLFVRHLDCGSCNGCELELNALRNPVYDIAKDGIVFEPFPRQASVLVVTGVYTRNLAEIAAAAYDAMPEPRRVLLVGDCAKDGGVFTHSYAVNAWPATLAQIDTCHVAGCPPAPEDIRKALIELR